MNILFIDPNYIEEKSWKYLLKVLKIKSMYSFIPYDEISDSCKNCCENIHKHWIGKEQDKKKFADGIVFSVVNKCKRYVSQIERYIYIPAFENSKWYTFKNNITQTEDPNVIVLTKTSYNTEDGVTFGFADGEEIPTCIARFILNLLKKYNPEYPYYEKICISKVDLVGNKWKIFRNNRFIYKTINSEKNDNFIGYVNYLLHNGFPEKYPIIDRKYANIFYNKDKRSKEKESRNMIDKEYRDRQEDSRGFYDTDWEQLNREFYDEIGDSSVNLM